MVVVKTRLDINNVADNILYSQLIYFSVFFFFSQDTEHKIIVITKYGKSILYIYK